jgi:hypothetical protein
MAAEFPNGKLVTFFDKLTAKNGERPPAFDFRNAGAYWKWFSENFDAGQATDLIEKASTEKGKIEWIDFRVPVNDVVNTMHIHVEAAGQYHTGTLAYRLVRRAFSSGIRIVGTLKAGPDFNVLALFEK